MDDIDDDLPEDVPVDDQLVIHGVADHHAAHTPHTQVDYSILLGWRDW